MRKLAAGLLLGLGAAGLVLLVEAFAALDTAELKAYDWRVRRTADPASVSREIVLVEINDTSIRDLEPLAGRWPWPRVVIASLLDYLHRGRAKVIAIDLTIAERDLREGFPYGNTKWSGAESDAALVESVRTAGTVVMLADAVYEGAIGASQQNAPSEWKAAGFRLGPAIEERRLVVPPFQALSDGAVALGHNFLTQDPDGPVRRIAPFIRAGDRHMPSLGVAAGLIAAGIRPEEVVLAGRTIRLRDREMPLVPVTVRDAHTQEPYEKLTTLINYRAPAVTDGVRPYRSFEVRHLLLSEEQILEGQTPLVDPAEFTGKTVFVGLSTSGLMDVFNTPFGKGVMPGIQLHASVADSVMTGRFIRPAGRASQIAVTMAIALVVALMSAALPYTAAAAGSVLLALAWTWFSLIVFRRGVWVDLAGPLIVSAIALFAGTSYRYFVEERQKRVVKRLFGRYVSKDVYHQLLANPQLAELGGARREMTVLFSDIRGFTTVTEKGDPEALVAQLNEYFSRMVEIVFRHHGTVDKFVGDMVMALFGAPVDDQDHAEHAVQAGVDMVGELGRLNQQWKGEGRPELDIGVGINSGEMIAGNIGSSSIMSYTVIGDNVNLASRLESLNKQYGTRIIISDATRQRLRNSYELRPLGDVVVKGKSRAVAIFEIAVPAPVAAVAEDAPS